MQRIQLLPSRGIACCLLGTLVLSSGDALRGSSPPICNATATGFELLEKCASAALCDAARGGSTGCSPGATRCNGAELQRCNADGTRFETLDLCATAALCRLGASGCAPGETRCSGSILMRCNDDQTGYETLEQCPAGCERGACLDVNAGPADAGKL